MEITVNVQGKITLDASPALEALLTGLVTAFANSGSASGKTTRKAKPGVTVSEPVQTPAADEKPETSPKLITLPEGAEVAQPMFTQGHPSASYDPKTATAETKDALRSLFYISNLKQLSEFEELNRQLITDNADVKREYYVKLTALSTSYGLRIDVCKQFIGGLTDYKALAAFEEMNAEFIEGNEELRILCAERKEALKPAEETAAPAAPAAPANPDPKTVLLDIINNATDIGHLESIYKTNSATIEADKDLENAMRAMHAKFKPAAPEKPAQDPLLGGEEKEIKLEDVRALYVKLGITTDPTKKAAVLEKLKKLGTPNGPDGTPTIAKLEKQHFGTFYAYLNSL